LRYRAIGGPPLPRVIKVIWGPEAGLSISAHFDEGFLMIHIPGGQDCWSEKCTFEEMKNSGD
jgi:hypothetical protein